MKKYTFCFLFLLGFLITTLAQRNTATYPSNFLQHHSKKNYSNFKTSAGNNKVQSIGSAWFNFTDYLEYLSPGTATSSFMSLFPDTSIILGFNSGTPVYPFIHYAANYLDPAFLANQSLISTKFATYTVDSIEFGYGYDRPNHSSTIFDSIIIQVIGENHALDYVTGTPPFHYQDIEFDYITKKIKSTIPVIKRISVPIGPQDTAAGGIYKKIRVAVGTMNPITMSKKVGVVVNFKPMYSYTINDTLVGGHIKNSFYMISVEQNGDGGGSGTDPIIADDTTNMNMSYILDKSVLYNETGNSWNGYFSPTYSYVTGFSYESHDIGYKLKVSNVGVSEMSYKGFELAQNIPNPFISTSTVQYQLAKDADSAMFTVTDVTGRTILTEKVSTSAGLHSINLSYHSAGVYYYTLTIDGNSTTKKMIAQ